MQKPTPVQRIEMFMERAGWTKTRLAAAVGRSESALNKVLAGSRKMSPALAIDLQLATTGAVRRKEVPATVRALRAADLHPKVRALLDAERAAAAHA